MIQYNLFLLWLLSPFLGVAFILGFNFLVEMYEGKPIKFLRSFFLMLVGFSCIACWLYFGYGIFYFIKNI